MSFQLTDLLPDPTSSVKAPTDARNFPLFQEDIKADPRVSWSRLSNKWSLETDDGEEYEFDEALRRWIPVVRYISGVGEVRGESWKAFVEVHNPTLGIYCYVVGRKPLRRTE